jgi:hypothetical protein
VYIFYILIINTSLAFVCMHIQTHIHLQGCFQAWSNRAACYLSLENFAACIEDCTRALHIIDPAQVTPSLFFNAFMPGRHHAHLGTVQIHRYEQRHM